MQGISGVGIAFGWGEVGGRAGRKGDRKGLLRFVELERRGQSDDWADVPDLIGPATRSLNMRIAAGLVVRCETNRMGSAAEMLP